MLNITMYKGLINEHASFLSFIASQSPLLTAAIYISSQALHPRKMIKHLP